MEPLNNGGTKGDFPPTKGEEGIIIHGVGQVKAIGGVPMEQALDEKGCDLCRQFFQALLLVYPKVSVSGALFEWRKAYGNHVESEKQKQGRVSCSNTRNAKYQYRVDWLKEHDLPNNEAAFLACQEWGLNYTSAYQWILKYRKRMNRH